MAKDDAVGAGLDAAGVEELRYMQQVYQNQYAVASNSINMLLQELQELNSVQKTMENADILEGKSLLTNIGADTFMFSSVQDTKTMLMAVGAGYVVEKDIDSAKARVAALIQKRTESLNRIIKSRKEVEAALIEISYRLDSIH
jgi:prefoldin alpha subunit